ncbi:hypothetical protein HPDFL43_00002000 [Hoeflea phototrophica DFL-43]|uniref:Uncharacterized protein n=1 Tax=Hoeflea phototrophica (strain DSM 17068 / NCIMB 14078 / DFL-43) TaxID=411684 RepID=A0A094Z0F6_HOEPD|nr:hypothetical protein HPDFL43_00002000 [Hoeflea phototrophica DFL-43]
MLSALPLPDGSRTCRTRREEGLLRIWRNVRQFAKGGGHHRSSAGGRSLSEERAKPATGPGFASCQPQGWIWAETPVRACGGHERLSLAGQGPCRTPAKPFPWPVQAAAGAIRAGVKSRGWEDLPVGCGHHPASFGPRAGCATHYLHSFRRQSPRAALRNASVKSHPGFHRRGFAAVCRDFPIQLWAKMSVSSQPMRSSLARVGRNSKQAFAWASRSSRWSRSVSFAVSA